MPLAQSLGQRPWSERHPRTSKIITPLARSLRRRLRSQRHTRTSTVIRGFTKSLWQRLRGQRSPYLTLSLESSHSDLIPELVASPHLNQLEDVSMIDASVVVAAGDQHDILTQNPPSGSEKEPLVYAQLANESHDLVLEKLPAELRLHVLSQLDMESLKSLVHASPVYHAQYLMDRKQLLFKTLMTTLGGAALDAQLAFHSGKQEFQDALSRETVERFLRSYETYRSSSPWHLPHAMSGDGAAFDNFCLNDTFTLAEVSSMVKFHSSVIKPLVQYFAEWALENMIQLPGAQSYSQPLSGTEKVRLFRALYRYQICCNLFGSQLGELEATHFDAEYILMQLETLFEPWENEEVVCITLFFESKSNTLATVIRRDLDGNHDKCDEELKPQLDNPFGPSDESGECDYHGCIVSTMLEYIKLTGPFRTGSYPRSSLTGLICLERNPLGYQGSLSVTLKSAAECN